MWIYLIKDKIDRLLFQVIFNFFSLEWEYDILKLCFMYNSYMGKDCNVLNMIKVKILFYWLLIVLEWWDLRDLFKNRKWEINIEGRNSSGFVRLSL